MQCSKIDFRAMKNERQFNVTSIRILHVLRYITSITFQLYWHYILIPFGITFSLYLHYFYFDLCLCFNPSSVNQIFLQWIENDEMIGNNIGLSIMYTNKHQRTFLYIDKHITWTHISIIRNNADLNWILQEL